jgi:homospermidine synthase
MVECCGRELHKAHGMSCTVVACMPGMACHMLKQRLLQLAQSGTLSWPP